MSDEMVKRRWSWPLAFFVLNVVAICVWFAWFAFPASRELSVLRVAPGVSEVDPASVTEIDIIFASPIDAHSVAPDSIRFAPPLRGRVELAGPDRLRFLPSQPLAAATTYTVVLSPALRGTRGELPPRELIELSTSRFKLESVSQSAYDRDSYVVEMAFNQPIAASDLEKAIAFTSSRRVSTSDSSDKYVSVIGNANDKRHRLRIRETRPSHILLTLPAGLAGSSGPLGLAEEASVVCHIAANKAADEEQAPEWASGKQRVELRPEVAFLGMTAEWDNGSGVVRIRTTTPLDPTRAGEFVTVSPGLPITFASTWNGLKILGDFQPGRQYRITLAAGMPAGHAGTLGKEISRQVWFDDLPPSLYFAYGGGFLSPAGMLKVPVRSRNLSEFRLGVRRMYASNIVEAVLREYGEDVDEDYAEPEIDKLIQTTNERNREHETILDLRQLAGESPIGVYGLEVWQQGRRWRSRTAMVAVSDLGLAARLGRTTLLAWTTSIREGTPRAGIRVTVYSNKRQRLAEAVSGDDGAATLALPPLPDGEKAALLLAEAGNGEYSFVRLDRDARSRPAETRRGDAYADGYEVFLTAERGVYRGGETVRLAGLVRDERVETVADLPLELALVGPDGRERAKLATVADAAGRIEAEARLGEAYPGGVYRVRARLPGQTAVLGEAMFTIADYLPETLSVVVEFEEKKKPDIDHALLIRVARLAGGELGGVPVEVSALYRPVDFAPDGWADWSFGDARVTNKQSERRTRTAMLGRDGEARASWTDPIIASRAAVGMTVTAEVSETGGRSASASIDRLVHQVPYYVGVKQAGRGASVGKPVDLQLAAVTPDGTAARPAKGWSAELFRVEYNGVMKQNGDGRIVYEWLRREIAESSYSGEWSDGKATIAAEPRAGGSYRLAIDAADGKGCTFDFTVQGPGSKWYGEDPEALILVADAAGYKVGDTAVVSTSAPFAGKALITLETDEVLRHWTEDIEEGDNTFDVAIEESMRPNAFLSLTLVRPAAAEAEWKPHRLSGTVRLAVDNTDRRLDAALNVPAYFTPNSQADIAVEVNRDGKPVAEASVTLWAVDVGVLSLTGYDTPSPHAAFYRRRRAGVREADMFSRLAPELAEWLGGNEASPGGDGIDGEFSRRLNAVFAKRVKPVVLFAKKLVTDAEGKASASLPVPEFAGKLRIMCWAASGNAMGAAGREVEVRAPVSVQAEWPRFAAPGDEFDVVATVLNRSGGDATISLTATGDDMLSLEPAHMDVTVADNQATLVRFRATAKQAGVADVAIAAALGDASFASRVELSVRPPVLFSRESGVVSVPAGEKTVFSLASGLLPANSKVKLMAGGNPQVQLTGSLDALLDYPYGCAEQTASRLAALVYLPDLLALSRPGQVESGEISQLATACIERLVMMQTTNGSLKMWPGSGEGLFWVSAQALNTLCECIAAGYDVPKRLVDNLSEYLNRTLDKRLSADDLAGEAGENVAQALLGLARAEKLNRSWLLRLEEIATSQSKQCRPLPSAALAFLCEATAIAGDRQAATELFKRFNPEGSEPGAPRNEVVERAAWLSAAMACGMDAETQALLARRLEALLDQGYVAWSTRQNSMALVALGRYWQKEGPAPAGKAKVALSEGKGGEFDTRRGGVWNALTAGTRVEVDNGSDGTLRLFWLAEGVPASGKAVEEDRNLVARRTLYRLDGAEVKAPYSVRRGEVYEVRLSISGKADDLVIADLLPAGLEIEDANLKGRRAEAAPSGTLSVKHVEIRDDRLLVFAALSGKGEYRYLVRAVSSGRFAWPAVDASRMYDLAVRSVNGAGELLVEAESEDRGVANDR